MAIKTGIEIIFACFLVCLQPHGGLLGQALKVSWLPEFTSCFVSLAVTVTPHVWAQMCPFWPTDTTKSCYYGYLIVIKSFFGVLFEQSIKICQEQDESEDHEEEDTPDAVTHNPCLAHSTFHGKSL